jgi:hypothetical protein
LAIYRDVTLRFLGAGYRSRSGTTGAARSDAGDENWDMLEWAGTTERNAERLRRAVSGEAKNCIAFLNAPAKKTNPLSNPPILIQVNG